LLTAAVCLALYALCCPDPSRAAETTVHLKVIDWNVPAGTRIRATVKARLKVFYTSHQGVGKDGKPKAELQTPIDELAPQTLEWEVVTKPGPRASKEIEFSFPVKLAGLPKSVAGELFEAQFEVAEPGKGGSWEVARSDAAELGLFLEGEQLERPTACIRFTKDDSGYSIAIAPDCTAESFAAVASTSSTCPTCDARGDGR
jgi:hypothetical protein